MRNAISGAWLYGIVIVFTVFMVAFVSISLNYHNVFKMKTEIVTAIEQYSGLTQDSEERIKNIISNHGYLIRKRCRTIEQLNDDGSNYLQNYYGIIVGEAAIRNPGDRPVNICIYKEFDRNSNKYYYTVETFFGFVLPVVGDIFTFRITGETKSVDLLTPRDYWIANKLNDF